MAKRISNAEIMKEIDDLKERVANIQNGEFSTFKFNSTDIQNFRDIYKMIQEDMRADSTIGRLESTAKNLHDEAKKFLKDKELLNFEKHLNFAKELYLNTKNKILDRLSEKFEDRTLQKVFDTPNIDEAKEQWQKYKEQDKSFKYESSSGISHEINSLKDLMNVVRKEGIAELDKVLEAGHTTHQDPQKLNEFKEQIEVARYCVENQVSTQFTSYEQLKEQMEQNQTQNQTQTQGV